MIYYFAIVFSIFFILFVINLVRKNKLDEKYSILWLLGSIIILIVSIFPNIIGWFAEKFEVYYPPALMLLFGILILGAYVVNITVIVTKQNKMLVKLTQELGILKEKVEEIEKNQNKN